MSQQDASATCQYCVLVLDTRALASAKRGCTNLIFVEPGAKINGAVLLRCVAICSTVGDVFVFQQDNTPAHLPLDTVEFLRSETPQFISPDMWPANAPHLNSVNYHIWGMLQEHVYLVPISDADKLRKRLVTTWAEFQHSMVDDAVDR